MHIVCKNLEDWSYFALYVLGGAFLPHLHHHSLVTGINLYGTVRGNKRNIGPYYSYPIIINIPLYLISENFEKKHRKEKYD